MKDDLPWSAATSFDQYVVRLIEGKQTKTPEFETLLRFHGREKLEGIWKAHQAKKKAEKISSEPGKEVPQSEP